MSSGRNGGGRGQGIEGKGQGIGKKGKGGDMAHIAFTYEVDTPVGQVRLYAGETDPTGLNKTGGDRTRTDSEVEFLLRQNANDVRAAGAELLETKAAEYAQAAILLDQGNLRQNFLERSGKCLEMAKDLRNRASSPTTAAPRDPVFTLGTAGMPGSMERW